MSPIVSRVRTNQKLIVESAAFGLGYSAALIWVGSAFVGSFGDFDDAYPYWPAVKGLRTDTAGALAFAVALVALVLSRYLQLRRRGTVPVRTAERAPAAVAVQAVADIALVMATAVVIYLSA